MKPWNEWKARCAAGRCCAATQAALHTFGGQRYRTLAQRCLGAINVTDIALVTPPDADAWHLLEVHMTLPGAINGKAYKEWLFARIAGSGDAPFDIVQGGATLLMRSVVREHLRREYLAAGHVSANHPPSALPSGDDSTEEWLAGALDTSHAVETEELASLAAQHAPALFADVPRRVRMALAARCFHVSLSSPRLLDLTECHRNTLYNGFRELADRVHDYVRNHFPRDDRDTLRDLALAIFERLSHLCADWAVAEPACRPLLPEPLRPEHNTIEATA